MANQYNGPALRGSQHVYGDRLVNALAEIERLKTHAVEVYKLSRKDFVRMDNEIDHLNHCISNQENVVLAQKAEIERLKAAIDSLTHTHEKHKAALRVALVELRQYRLGGSTGDHHIQCAITTIKEALK